MNNGQFVFLIRHELKLESRRWATRSWYWLYLGALAVLVLVALAIWGGADGFKPDYLLYASFAFPFAFCMIAYRSLKREWSGGTFGWWLSLPYSRSRLLLAKLIASFIQSNAIALLFYSGMVFLGLFNVLVNGVDMDAFGSFVSLEVEYLLINVIASPLMLALGILLAAVGKSTLKPIIPLLWMAFGLLGNLFTWLNDAAGFQSEETWGLFNGALSSWFWIAAPAAWLLSALMFAGAVGICKKHLVL